MFMISAYLIYIIQLQITNYKQSLFLELLGL